MDAKTEALVKVVESLVAERQAVTQKEQELVRTLNSVLAGIGYEVVAKSDAGRRGPARMRRRRRRRGRAARAGRSARAGGPKRRGRAPRS